MGLTSDTMTDEGLPTSLTKDVHGGLVCLGLAFRRTAGLRCVPLSLLSSLCTL